jgi:hypothetical protein
MAKRGPPATSDVNAGADRRRAGAARAVDASRPTNEHLRSLGVTDRGMDACKTTNHVDFVNILLKHIVEKNRGLDDQHLPNP